MKKITWPISLPVGYMLREHVNRVRFPDWPYFFLQVFKKEFAIFIDNDKYNKYLLYLLAIKIVLITNRKVNIISFIFL